MCSIAQPLDGVAGIDVDDLQPAAGDRVLGGEPLVEREALEGAVAARPRQPDHRVAAGEGEPARIAGAERDRRERAASAIDGAELAGAGVEQPQPVPS